MAAKQGATVSVRILVDEEKKRVVCAETGNDFVDILFGFLTLPMGTIVRLIRKNRSELGSMSNLYRSVEANFSLDNFWTNACMDMLLHPRTPLETICRGLKINVNDSEPTRYFICSDLECSWKQNVRLFSNYANSICKCGKLMNKEIFALTSASNTSETDGVFVTRSTAYIVSDSFKITASTPGVLVELLRNTGVKDLNCLEERVVKVGSEEILNLLERSLVSKSPLTDVFLSNQSYPSELSLHNFLPQNIVEKATSGSMVVKMATKNKPTEVAGKSGEPEALSGGTAVEKAAEVPKESAPKVAVPTATVDKADQRGPKRPAESREPVQKRARTSTALDIAAPFVIQSKVCPCTIGCLGS
ncbi:hypothetical protein CsSME_00038706 [Camellia sinensis var. sinensis]